jgi:hypothetical protein
MAEENEVLSVIAADIKYFKAGEDNPFTFLDFFGKSAAAAADTYRKNMARKKIVRQTHLSDLGPCISLLKKAASPDREDIRAFLNTHKHFRDLVICGDSGPIDVDKLRSHMVDIICSKQHTGLFPGGEFDCAEFPLPPPLFPGSGKEKRALPFRRCEGQCPFREKTSLRSAEG